MPDYYELLGIARDASTAEIKSAYRERIEQARDGGTSRGKGVVVASAAELNQAWNVLADPFQRRRYDEQLRGAEAPEADGDGETAPAPRPAGRRRPPRSAVPATQDRAAEAGSGNGDTGGPRRRPPAEPIELPNGLVAPPTRNRINALVVDVLLVYLAAMLVGFAFVPFQRDAYQVYKGGKPVGSAHIVKGNAAQQKQQLLADEQAKVAKATKPGNKPAKVEVKKISVLSGGVRILQLLASFAAGLLVVLPASVLTGQTLGKKIFGLRLVTVDGAPAGWRASTLHYGIPILLGIMLPTIGALIAVALVVWFVRDPLRQGVHDKLAKTFVVMAPKASPAR